MIEWILSKIWNKVFVSFDDHNWFKFSSMWSCNQCVEKSTYKNKICYANLFKFVDELIELHKKIQFMTIRKNIALNLTNKINNTSLFKISKIKCFSNAHFQYQLKFEHHSFNSINSFTILNKCFICLSKMSKSCFIYWHWINMNQFCKSNRELTMSFFVHEFLRLRDDDDSIFVLFFVNQ